MNTSDWLLANGRPEDVALIDARGTHTFRDLMESSGRLAAELSGLGLQPGTTVGIMAGNSLFWVATYLAVMKLGLVAVPFPLTFTPAELRRNADWVGCRAMALDRAGRQKFADSGAAMAVITENVLAGSAPTHWPVSQVSPEADAALMFTSGTTEQPRAVRVTHRNIQANTESIISYLGLQRDDRIQVILPFSYCFGISLLHTHLRVGGSVALWNNFTFPETALDALERTECTGFAGVPSSYQLLLRASSFRERELPSLRRILQAGGKLTPALIDELVNSQPKAEVFVMYGQTEATARLSYLPPELVLTKQGSIGKGIPGVELQVLDERGRAVTPGETGEICARGDNISPGYFNDPEATAEKFRDGLLRTGDLATVDSEGFIYVVDRIADFIKSWGYRISSQEIEACALQLADLLSVAVVGVPDPDAGEAVTLFGVVRPGASLSAEDIIDHCGRHLPRHMVPRQVHLVAALPLNSSGKIAKKEVRELAVRQSQLARSTE